MNGRALDLAIVGGGLAGGLIALAVHRAHPEMRIGLFEQGERLGGNHRWSWFASDLGLAGKALIGGFPASAWNGGYEVRFPAYGRVLATGYRSLASRDFDARLRRELPRETIRTGCRVETLAPEGIVLASGERIAARTVIDCRPFRPSAHLAGGWQVFLGRHIRTRGPHGIERPIIMDAAVRQHGAYRFVYCLPLAEDEIFVEDTYYADAPQLDRPLLEQRIDRYCAALGWEGKTLGSEVGVLPVIAGGDFPRYRASLGDPGVVHAGARGGFVHPLTSYTLPLAVANALAIAGAARRPARELAALIEQRARKHWSATGFYRALGRMVFGAAEPDQRYRIFERFYRLPEPLIERFYAARSTPADKLRILAGRPPVPVHRALGALLGKGAPLVHDGAR